MLARAWIESTTPAKIIDDDARDRGNNFPFIRVVSRKCHEHKARAVRQLDEGSIMDMPITVPHTAREALTTGQWDPIAELLENRDKVDVKIRELGVV